MALSELNPPIFPDSMAPSELILPYVRKYGGISCHGYVPYFGNMGGQVARVPSELIPPYFRKHGATNCHGSVRTHPPIFPEIWGIHGSVRTYPPIFLETWGDKLSWFRQN